MKSEPLSRIMMMFKDSSNHVKWLFRGVTQEDEIVLDYKQKKENYYPSDIKWDSTKIRFPKTESGR
jgi:hypothetical protein